MFLLNDSFAICKFIFRKAEVQKVSLRCLTDLICSKVMTQNSNISISVFLRFCKKRPIGFFTFCFLFAFCVIPFVPIKISTGSAPQNDRLNLSFCER